MAVKYGNISNIRDATVFIDRNNDGIKSSNEVGGTADQNGRFTLTGLGYQLKGTLVSSGGTNISTGEANTEVFTDIMPAKVVNSLTTLITSVAQQQDITRVEAAKMVKAALGLGNFNVLNKDPADVIEHGRAGSMKVSQAFTSLEAQKQIDTLLNMGVAVLNGSSAGTTTAGLQAGMLASLAEKIVAGGTVELSNESLIADVINGGALTAGISATEQANVAALATTAASVINASLTQISDTVATGLQSDSAVDAALSRLVDIDIVGVSVAAALELGAANSNLANVVTAYTGEALLTVIADPTPPIIVPPVVIVPPAPSPSDTAGPTLSSNSPADNAIGIAVGDNIVLTFNESVVLGTGNIEIRKTSDNSVVASFDAATGLGNAGGSIVASGSVVTVNPFALLTAGTEYYVTVPATAVKDLSGNAYTGINSMTAFSFTTAIGSSNMLTLTTGADSITGTAGNDTFVGTYDNGAVTDTLNDTDVLKGGEGAADILNITAGAVAITPPDALWANKTNIEKISFDSTGAGAQVITTGANFQSAFSLNGVNLTAQTLLGAIDITMTGFTGDAAITTITIGDGAHTIITGTGDANVNATSLAAGAQTIYGPGLAVVNATINGAGNQTIGNDIGGGVKLETVNATVLGAGSQTITSTSTNAVSVVARADAGAQTITTGAGNDNVSVITATGQTATITTGSGRDTIVASLGTDLITGGSGSDVMTGGGGVDTFAFGTDGSIVNVSTDAITDFNTADADILTFNGATTSLLAADATALVAGANVQTTAGGLVIFAAADNTWALKVAAILADVELDAAGSIAMFVDGGNTYVYYAGTATGNVDDQLIQLTGITSLVTITGGATTTIT